MTANHAEAGGTHRTGRGDGRDLGGKWKASTVGGDEWHQFGRIVFWLLPMAHAPGRCAPGSREPGEKAELGEAVESHVRPG